MTTPKNKKPTNTSSRPVYRRKSSIVLAIVALLVLVGIVAAGIIKVNENKAVAADRTRFDQVEQNLKVIDTAIISEVGDLNKNLQKKTCSQPYREIGEAPVTCRIEYQLTFQVGNSEEANLNYRKIGPIIRKTLNFDARTLSSGMDEGLFSSAEVSSPQILEKYTDKKDLTDCRVAYSLVQNNGMELSVNIACLGKVTKPLYRLE